MNIPIQGESCPHCGEEKVSLKCAEQKYCTLCGTMLAEPPTQEATGQTGERADLMRVLNLIASHTSARWDHAVLYRLSPIPVLRRRHRGSRPAPIGPLYDVGWNEAVIRIAKAIESREEEPR